jgi:hypothetical protein
MTRGSPGRFAHRWIIWRPFEAKTPTGELSFSCQAGSRAAAGALVVVDVMLDGSECCAELGGAWLGGGEDGECQTVGGQVVGVGVPAAGRQTSLRPNRARSVGGLGHRVGAPSRPVNRRAGSCW